MLRLRTEDTLTPRHPGIRFLALPSALAEWQAAGHDMHPFHEGVELLHMRYRELGMTRLLPPERVAIGTESADTAAWGGFHHPDQGYRHLQMRALITMYGPLTSTPQNPSLSALDLLRSYAHDCLHYGSYRSYRLRNGEIVRSQYGVNFRRPDGRTYSAPDTADAPGTRNLGVVMEGACDWEARAITRRAAERCGIQEPEGPDRFAYRDSTGRLNAADLRQLTSGHGLAPHAGAARFLESMGRYTTAVNSRYAWFLDDAGPEEGAELHAEVLRALISGSVSGLCAWLDVRHGPGEFLARFRTPSY
ncbi:hypothetical protein EF910_06975 [Streptomyces sp. WAC07149]|nr:hypothetical protein EF910_06975 [Streptomyces sp. WAC07149]